jgi:capsid protein
MALITGALPLPLAKYKKFNKPVFQGRRWKQVDEVKAINAAALRVANNMSSLSRENADLSQDFEEIAFERAEEKMLLEELGLPFEQTCDPRAAAAEVMQEETEPPKATNGKSRIDNGAHVVIRH